MMKKNRVAVYIFLFLVSTLIISCEKNVAKKFKGNYQFTTITWSYCGFDSNSDTIKYQGTITENSKTSLKIDYAIPVNDNTSCTGIYVDGVINLNVDADGNLDYPDYVSGDYHKYFQGTFDDSGNVNIQFGRHGLGSGKEQKITGRKL